MRVAAALVFACVTLLAESARADADAGAPSAEPVGRVTFEPPVDVVALDVRLDGRPVPRESLTRNFTVAIGQHAVSAQGVLDGRVMGFHGHVTVDEGQLVTVRLPMTPLEITHHELPRCVLSARDEAELHRCIAWGVCMAIEPDTDGCTVHGFDARGQPLDGGPSASLAPPPTPPRSCGACTLTTKREAPAHLALSIGVPLAILAARRRPKPQRRR